MLHHATPLLWLLIERSTEPNIPDEIAFAFRTKMSPNPGPRPLPKLSSSAKPRQPHQLPAQQAAEKLMIRLEAGRCPPVQDRFSKGLVANLRGVGGQRPPLNGSNPSFS